MISLVLALSLSQPAPLDPTTPAAPASEAPLVAPESAQSTSNPAPPEPEGPAEAPAIAPAPAAVAEPLTVDEATAASQHHGHAHHAPHAHSEVTPTPQPDAEAPSQGGWRIALAGGDQVFLAARAGWVTAPHAPHFQMWVERGLGSWLSALPGLGIRLGFAQRGASTGPLALTYSEAQLGVFYELPAAGLWDVFFPYARVDALGGFARLNEGGPLAASAFVPGIAGNLGVRIALPRMGKGKVSRFFAVAEGGYEARLAARPALHGGGEEDDEREPLPETTTDLGRLRLSGTAWRIGFGVQF